MKLTKKEVRTLVDDYMKKLGYEHVKDDGICYIWDKENNYLLRHKDADEAYCKDIADWTITVKNIICEDSIIKIVEFLQKIGATDICIGSQGMPYINFNTRN